MVGGLAFALMMAAAACSSPARTAPCPATVPAAGTPCLPPDLDELTCEYGSGALHDCTTIAFCDGSGGTWHVNPPYAGCAGTPALCPATSAGIQQGAPCTNTHLRCQWADKVCQCETCGRSDGTTSAFMNCRSRDDVAPGCPAQRPLLGTPCTSEGLQCTYDECCLLWLGDSEECAGGLWRVYDDGCGGGTACALPNCPTSQSPPPPASL